MKTSPMSQMTAVGEDWWNDSGVPSELAEAVALGAVGGTSNPVIVSQAVKAQPDFCNPIIDRLLAEFPTATEDDIAWKLIHTLARASAEKLLPVYNATRGQKGFLSVQVNPKYYPNKDLMVAQAVELAALAPNIAIKAPATEVGIAAMEEMTGRGIRINATVSFTVAQVIAVGEALKRGLLVAEKNGKKPGEIRPYITLMVGRVDDHLRRLAEKEKMTPVPASIEWAGIAVFKRAYQELQHRKLPGTLLAAAYRHAGHWSQIIGRDVLQTVPYNWWTKFHSSDHIPGFTLQTPVDEGIVAELRSTFPDFVRALEPDGLAPSEFVKFGPTVHTLNQFLGGYSDLLAQVRARMLPITI